MRNAILLQSSDFTISVEADRGHIAQQLLDDAHLLLSARTQDLLAPGAGDAEGEGRLAAAPGVLGKVIQGTPKELRVAARIWSRLVVVMWTRASSGTSPRK